MKSFFSTLVFIFLSGSLFAQSNSSAVSSGTGRFGTATTFLQDYQTVGINPANLGLLSRETKMFTLGIAENTFMIHSSALTKKDIFKKVLQSHTLSDSEKTVLIHEFVNNPTAISIETMPLGFALQIPKFGGIGFTWRNRLGANYSFNNAVSNLIFKGIHYTEYFDTIVHYNNINYGIVVPSDSAKMLSEIFDGSTINYAWTQEFNLSYGRKLLGTDLLNLYAGVGVKLIQGMGVMDVHSEDGSLSGFTANSPVLQINYGSLNLESAVLGNGLKPVGRGMGFDFGVTATIHDNIKAGIALTDLGSVNWTGNLLTIHDMKFDSLENFEGTNTLSPADIFKDFLNTDGLFTWEEGVEKKIPLPSKLRIGASIALGKMLEVGFDLVQPFNNVPGNIDKTYLAIGVDLQPIPNLTFSTGMVAGGNTDFDIPFGIAISAGPKQIYQFGISTGDVLVFMESDKPTLSMSLGFLRFQF